MRCLSALLVAAVACTLTACGPSDTPPTIVVTSTEFVSSTPSHTPHTTQSLARAPKPEPSPSPAETPGVSATSDAQSLIDDAVQAASALGTAGVAANGAEGVVAAGFQEKSPAWSTIKVPIAVAALRVDQSVAADATAAITYSDNEAAQRLYGVAGEQGTNAILSEAGVAAQVNTAQIRPEFSTFGQTALSVTDQALMANALACVSGAGQVIQLMGQIDPGQSYGLGAVNGMFKGGWGPDTAGMYQVRQFGWIPRSDGTYAPVALTAMPADGTYETGQQMLTTMAQSLSAHADVLTPAVCQP